MVNELAAEGVGPRPNDRLRRRRALPAGRRSRPTEAEEKHHDRSDYDQPDGPSRTAKDFQRVRTGGYRPHSRLDHQPVGGGAEPVHGRDRQAGGDRLCLSSAVYVSGILLLIFVCATGISLRRSEHGALAQAVRASSDVRHHRPGPARYPGTGHD